MLAGACQIGTAWEGLRLNSPVRFQLRARAGSRKLTSPSNRARLPPLGLGERRPRIGIARRRGPAQPAFRSGGVGRAHAAPLEQHPTEADLADGSRRRARARCDITNAASEQLGHALKRTQKSNRAACREQQRRLLTEAHSRWRTTRPSPRRRRRRADPLAPPRAQRRHTIQHSTVTTCGERD